jgi:Glycosyltransferase family 87
VLATRRSHPALARVNARRQIAVALWIIVSAAAVIVFKALPSSVADYQDFKPYYVGSLALRRGVNPYDGDFETVFIEAGRPLGSLSAWERSEPLLDTPAWLIFFEPFTFLKPATAYWAWATFNMLCLAAALFVLISDIGPPGADGWTVAALMLLYPPISINFWFAQSEVFLLLIFALALRALRRRHDGAAGVMLATAALLRAYPLGMLGYLIAKRNWRATGYCLATCVIGSALAAALLGFQPIVSFARLAVPGSGTHSVPSGLLRHPANLNLGSFVQLVFGYRGWAFVTGMAIELLLAGFAFAITGKVENDPYGCGFSLWIVVITLLSPVAWPQFLVCIVPLYVGIAAANREGRLARRVLNVASASYLAALFMGGPLGFLSRGLARAVAGHVHVSYVLPAKAAFISLMFALSRGALDDRIRGCASNSQRPDPGRRVRCRRPRALAGVSN